MDELEDGPLRSGALRRRLEGISQKVLTDKVRDLEDEGLLARTVVDKPLAVYYELTPLGRTLVEPLTALRDLGPGPLRRPARQRRRRWLIAAPTPQVGSNRRTYARCQGVSMAPVP